MSNGPGSHAPSWRTPAPQSAGPSVPAPPAWQAPPARAPYRPRWRRLALVAAGALLALFAVTWAVLWIRPPDPARLVVFQAGYDATLAAPPNPYGKAAARELASLAKPGGWFGGRARMHGSPDPDRLARPGPQTLFPHIGAGREKCVVMILAAHGGRDRDGAFLFPDDATPDPAHRVRLKAVIDRLAQLPPARQKLLILDATQSAAFPDIGLIHNDFAAGLDDLHDAIAAVPNLVVFASTGPDQRSWASPEWGTTAFGHFLHVGLAGAADADGDKRVNGWELAEYVRPRVHDWARDHRAALQTPVLLPRGTEGERRARAMHLAMTGDQPAPAAPTPFEPPPEVRQAWDEYRELARGTPPPDAYTPHLWRQYEAWLLRLEQHALAGDTDGAKTAREKASTIRRRIEDDRRLAVRPQTLALPVGVGSVPRVAKLPDAFATGITRVANPDPAFSPGERLKEWDAVRAAATGFDAETTRLLWARALVEFVAEDPVGRRAVVPAVLPMVAGGFDLQPAEVNFLANVAAHLPPPEKATAVGPLLKRVLTLRQTAERAALCVPERGYPYAEFAQPWVLEEVRQGDTARRQAEDLCFATRDEDWENAAKYAAAAEQHYDRAFRKAAHVRTLVAAYHSAAARVPELGEWLVRDVGARSGIDRLARELAFRNDLTVWDRIHAAAGVVRVPATSASDAPAFDPLGENLRGRVRAFDSRLAKQTDELIAAKPEFEGKVTPRADAVRWLHAADALLTAPPPEDAAPARRVDLLREFRRVTRQLLVISETRPEALPEVSADITRERAFDAARRRGQFLLARIGPADFAALAARKPGETYAQVEFRIGESGFPASGRQSLAEAGSRLGEILAAMPDAVGGSPSPDADRLIRLAAAPAAADVTGSPAAQLRRTGVRELLLTQARRTLADHWYSPQGDPYYRRAIDQLTADAGRLVPRPAESDEFTKLRTAEEPFPVKPAVPERLTVTDEPDPRVTIAFTRQDGISGRPGFPVFAAGTWWGTPVPGTLPPAWVPVLLDPTRQPDPIVRPITRPPGPPSATPAARTGTVRVNGFFRGRVLPFAPPVNLYDVPNQASVTTPPVDPYAKLAVRADPSLAAKYGIGAGSIAFVLDCSGSMRPNPDVPGSRGLYPAAVDALADVLGSLPPGTVVSVRTFGQRTPGATTPEDTIRELVPPTPLPLERGPVIAGIVERAKAVSTNDLYERSPVVRAVIEAKRSLRAAPGPFKAVVLISDAVDNRYTATTKHTVADGLRNEFTDGGVLLGVVAMPVTDPAELAVQAAFRMVEKLRPAGKFVPPARAKELAAWLRTGLNPRLRYAVEPVDSDSPVSQFDLTATTDPPDEWYAGKLPRGRYRLELPGLGFRRDVWLGTGDRLLLDLTEDGDRLALRRHWFAATWPALARAGTDEFGWKLALLQNRLDAGRVQMLASIESRPPAATVVQADRVGDVWFEVTPVVPRPEPAAVRWRAVQGFPAPTWSVDIGGWPVVPGGKGGAAPRIAAWWNPDVPFSKAGTWVPPDVRKILDTRGVKLPAGDATLDTVTVETHRVEVQPGVFEPRPCLVARITHAADRPVWVRPAGVAPPVGSEVRFYREANRVTCLFWWDAPRLRADDVAARVVGFDVVALATAKAGPHLELTTAPPPSDTAPAVVPPAGTK